MHLGERINLLRREKGLTPSQLGAAMNKSEGAVRSWETGKANPDTETIIKLAELFKCTTDYLLGISNVRSMSKIDALENEMQWADREIADIMAKLKTAEAELASLSIQVQEKHQEVNALKGIKEITFRKRQELQAQWNELNKLLGN